LAATTPARQQSPTALTAPRIWSGARAIVVAREEKKIPAQKLVEEMARKHQTELQSANSSAAMARLVGTATKLTHTLELSPTLQLLICDGGSSRIHQRKVLFCKKKKKWPGL